MTQSPVDGGPLLSVRGLAMRYDATTALAAVDLDVQNGEFLTILGPSGSGKTTLLRLIGGFIEPSEGRILFDGVDIAHTAIEARPFNTVFQDYALFPHMNVAQNVGYGLMVRGRPKSEIAEKVAKYLEIVDLAGMERRHPAQLSGGQRQRVALARALICDPRLVLLDEPLAALDAGLRRQMQEFLKSIQRQTGVTFLFVTHDQDEAVTLSDRICVMAQGRVEQIGTARDIYYRPKSRFVATFFGDNNLIEGCRVTVDGACVETPLGVIDLAAPTALAGKRATLCIRPESLSPLSEGETADMSIQAQVTAVDFAGPVTRALLETDAGVRLSLKSFSRPERDSILAGARLTIGFTASATALIPAEAAP
ncbi:MAG: ABC transporter ATP-binding protein [Alphaproteobacteria bacterium]|nr:ABC transporter ATP-binding protein [Alphaproteobacteria bacterium]